MRASAASHDLLSSVVDDSFRGVAEWRQMPMLLRVGTKKIPARQWKCSSCGELFPAEALGSEPTLSILEQVHTQFREHCKEKHPEAPVYGEAADA